MQSKFMKTTVKDINSIVESLHNLKWLGSRLFWNHLSENPSMVNFDNILLFEEWDDSDVNDGVCNSELTFLNDRLRRLVQIWCTNLPKQSLRAFSLSLLGAFATCSEGGSERDFLLLDTLSTYFIKKTEYATMPGYQSSEWTLRCSKNKSLMISIEKKR